MATTASPALALREDHIASQIHNIRGERIMLDFDLATLYGVETKYLKRSVRRNIERFPADFMFTLTVEEFQNLRFQIGTSSWGGIRHAPYAFTEQGIAMLSGVLRSPRAVQVNIEIMRAFVQMRTWLSAHRELAQKVEALERKYDKNFHAVFEAIKKMIAAEERPRRPIGFQPQGSSSTKQSRRFQDPQ